MISILNNKTGKNLLQKAGCFLVCGAMVFSLSGCLSREVSTNANTNYDIIDTTSTEALEKGITQVIEVPDTGSSLGSGSRAGYDDCCCDYHNHYRYDYRHLNTILILGIVYAVLILLIVLIICVTKILLTDRQRRK